jgi:hypothetical protein
MLERNRDAVVDAQLAKAATLDIPVAPPVPPRWDSQHCLDEYNAKKATTGRPRLGEGAGDVGDS